MDNSIENVKIAIFLRLARATLGWGQEECAQKIGVSKSTIARVETLEMAPRADFLAKSLRVFKDAGLEIDLFGGDNIHVNVGFRALNEASNKLHRELQARLDKKKLTPSGDNLIPMKSTAVKNSHNLG